MSLRNFKTPIEQNLVIGISMDTDKTYVPLMHPDTSIVCVWSCMTVLAPVLPYKWLRTSWQGLSSTDLPYDCRWREGAQLLPQLKLCLCLWLQETLAMVLASAALSSLCTRKVIIHLPFGQKAREPILAPSLLQAEPWVSALWNMTQEEGESPGSSVLL